ncbi:hypothetical protein TUM4636_07730 [Shewanella glacialipiscicola]|nr:hypothetical protein [Shewanella glacialipiscicola]GIU06189.1 hypothetical protein TUM4636_07730 [Shewanella glacialipiscicola]
MIWVLGRFLTGALLTFALAPAFFARLVLVFIGLAAILSGAEAVSFTAGFDIVTLVAQWV